MRIWQAGDLVLLGFHHLAAIPGIRHAVATRIGGTSDPPYQGLNLGLRTGDDPEKVRAHRRAFCAALNVDPDRVAAGRQVHGDGLALVGAGALPGVETHPPGAGLIDADAAIPDTDALATAEPGVGIFLLVADCTPVLLADPVRRVVATVHAGWRGTTKRIAEQTVGRLEAVYGCRPADLIAGIGPAIGRCCYEVDDPVIRAVLAAQPADAPDLLTFKSNGRAQLDLAEANRRQLIDAGLRPESIELSGICTACTTALVYSERREGRPSGRFGALMAIDPGDHGTR